MSTAGEATLCLGGLHCGSCAGLIETALRRVPGVAAAAVDFGTARAVVRWERGDAQDDGVEAELVRAVRRAGYDAAPDTPAGAQALRRAEERRWLWRFFVAAFCSMQVMMLATPVYVAEAGTLDPAIEALLHRSAWTLSLPVLLFSAGPFFSGAWRALTRPRVIETGVAAGRLEQLGRRLSARLTMDVPVALGIAVAFVASSGAAFDPGGLFGREVYFDSLTMFVAFLLAGRWLEVRARHRALAAIEDLAADARQDAWRVSDDGRTEVVPVASLRAGDRVRVPLGETVPADGEALEGCTQVDESLLTGESRPVDKTVGSSLVAGSVNLGAPLLMRVRQVGEQTRRAQIAALMREALRQRPAAMRLADRLAGPFLLIVLLLAGGAVWWWWPVDHARALQVAVAVLVVTCPCALSLATPSALLSATAGLARRGVLLRRPEALETLARVRHVIFDKTGTVTERLPALQGMRPCVSGLDEVALRALSAPAASLAAHSRHPLSQALCAAVAVENGADPWREVQEQPGLGLQARDVHGRLWRLGHPRWWGAAEVVGGPAASLCFGDERRALVAMHFDEQLRAGAAAAMAGLRDDGVTLSLLSGDEPERVRALAGRLGIAHAVAAATPEGKLAALQACQAAGERVAMVGDGVNDAPVLARADVSFAMADGAQLAVGQADAVLLAARPGDVREALHLARRSARVLRQNLIWAALYNAACVPLALVGWLPPWAAGLGMAASSLLVVLNALRLAQAPAAPPAPLTTSVRADTLAAVPS